MKKNKTLSAHFPLIKVIALELFINYAPSKKRGLIALLLSVCRSVLQFFAKAARIEMEFERQIYHGNIGIKFDFWYDCAIFVKVMPLRLKKFHLFAVSVHFFFAEVVHIEMKFVIQIYLNF